MIKANVALCSQGGVRHWWCNCTAEGGIQAVRSPWARLTHWVENEDQLEKKRRIRSQSIGQPAWLMAGNVRERIEYCTSYRVTKTNSSFILLGAQSDHDSLFMFNIMDDGQNPHLWKSGCSGEEKVYFPSDSHLFWNDATAFLMLWSLGTCNLSNT